MRSARKARALEQRGDRAPGRMCQTQLAPRPHPLIAGSVENLDKGQIDFVQCGQVKITPSGHRTHQNEYLQTIERNAPLANLLSPRTDALRPRKFADGRNRVGANGMTF